MADVLRNEDGRGPRFIVSIIPIQLAAGIQHCLFGTISFDEINVSAGITGGGKLTLFGIAGAEAGVSGGLSFKFKKE